MERRNPLVEKLRENSFIQQKNKKNLKKNKYIKWNINWTFEHFIINKKVDYGYRRYHYKKNALSRPTSWVVRKRATKK